MAVDRVPLLCLAVLLAGCFGGAAVDVSCDEPQRYQSVGQGKKIVAPEGLDPLNELAEMPIPKAEDARQRPKGARCIELPPAIGASGS